MFGIPGKQAVTLTPAAVKQITRLMARDSAKGLRLGVKKGGFAGMEYTMEFVTDIDPMDEVIEQDGACVMIAPLAQMFLFGTEIDYETSLLESGFRFRAIGSITRTSVLCGTPATGDAAPPEYSLSHTRTVICTNRSRRTPDWRLLDCRARRSPSLSSSRIASSVEVQR